MYSCLYYSGRCDHAVCGDYLDGIQEPEPPQPTQEEYCAATEHSYYGDDYWDEDTLVGRCYCGAKIYEAGGNPI